MGCPSNSSGYHELKAYLYFDSLDSEIAVDGSAPHALDAAWRQYLANPAFASNDAGAPHHL